MTLISVFVVRYNGTSSKRKSRFDRFPFLYYLSGLMLLFSFLSPLPALTGGGDIAKGRKSAIKCAVCHGIDGIAKRPDVPHIAGESSLYLLEQLKNFRTKKRHHEQMTLIAKSLKPKEMKDIVAWYSALKITVTLPE